MKHPNRDSNDQTNRRNAADEATIIIGSDQPGAETVVAHTTPEAPMVKNLGPDPGHTRILRPMGVVDDIKSDPVVGWLVVLDGPGKGNFRAVFSGSNTIGRASNQRIPIDFNDDAISNEKQAFLVYDGRKRQFQLVPNLERPNLVHLNDAALLANAELKPHDKVMMGRTTLLFVPLCGPEFDWTDAK